MSTDVQSLIFDKLIWNPTNAIEWMVKHGYNYMKFHETKNYYRFRLSPPDKRKRKRTVQFGKDSGIKAIIEF